MSLSADIDVAPNIQSFDLPWPTAFTQNQAVVTFACWIRRDAAPGATQQLLVCPENFSCGS